MIGMMNENKSQGAADRGGSRKGGFKVREEDKD